MFKPPVTSAGTTSAAPVPAILITDDNAMMRFAARTAIEKKWGKSIRIVEATCADEAIIAVRKQLDEFSANFDVIIMDQNMPYTPAAIAKNGEDAVLKIREMENAKDLADNRCSKIITWSSEREVKFNYTDDIMEKPLRSPKVLQAKIEALLQSPKDLVNRLPARANTPQA